MIAAVVIACLIMYLSSGPVARFVAEHPTTKMLALAFLVLIGVALVADGFKFHIPRGYIYFAIAFSAAVEALQRAGQAQPEEQPPLIHRGVFSGLELTTLASMAFAWDRKARRCRGRARYDQGRARAQGGGPGSPGL